MPYFAKFGVESLMHTRLGYHKAGLFNLVFCCGHASPEMHLYVVQSVPWICIRILAFEIIEGKFH